MIKYFSRNLHSDRLVLKHLVPNLQNAKMIYDVLKNENPKDYKYEPLVPRHVLPKSVKETLNMMNHYKDFEDKDGCVFYMFYNNEFIGVRKLCYFKEASTLKFSTVWLIRSARRKGFAKESFRLLEDIAFNKLKVNRISRVNIKENKDSEILAKNIGFILDGISRQPVFLDGHFYDLMIWSKLHTDYLKEHKK